MKFTRRSGRKQIVLKKVIPPGESPTQRSSENVKLVLAIARAHRWMEMLDRGDVKLLSELAKKVNLNISHVSRLLAPDLVKAILDGNEPSGLSLAKLRKGIPEVWAEHLANL